MRHVRREHDVADGDALVSAGDRERAGCELDVGCGRLEAMRGDLLGFLDDLVARLDDRRAADGDRARSVGAHAEGHPVGVAMDHVDVFDRHAEPVGDDLRKGGLVPLAVGVRSSEHGHRAGRVEAHLGGFVAARPGADRAGDIRGREPARFDIGGKTDSATLAAALRLFAPGLETREIRERQRFVQEWLVVPAVVQQRN